MNRIAARAVKWGLVVTAAAGVAAAASSGAYAIVLDVYLLCIGAVALLALVRATRAQVRAQRTSPFDAALAAMRRTPPESGEPPLVRELELSTYSAFHFYSRLRPLLRDVAAHRLRSRFGVSSTRSRPVRTSLSATKPGTSCARTGGRRSTGWRAAPRSTSCASSWTSWRRSDLHRGCGRPGRARPGGDRAGRRRQA